MVDKINNTVKKCAVCGQPMTSVKSCPLTAYGDHYEKLSRIEDVIRYSEGTLHG